MAFTNFDQLEEHLNRVFKEMLRSEELKKAGQRASQRMGEHVKKEVESGGESGYDYKQSGEFIELLNDEISMADVDQTSDVLKMGFAHLRTMNEGLFVGALRGEQTQEHVVGYDIKGDPVFASIRLKEEREMPKWIIAEFGSGPKADGRVPKKFRVSYTSRPDKDNLFGPSTKEVTGPGGGAKKGFFMVSDAKHSARAGSDEKGTKHPGVRPGRIFREGMKNAKKQVTEDIGKGIQSYLNNN